MGDPRLSNRNLNKNTLLYTINPYRESLLSVNKSAYAERKNSRERPWRVSIGCHGGNFLLHRRRISAILCLVLYTKLSVCVCWWTDGWLQNGEKTYLGTSMLGWHNFCIASGTNTDFLQSKRTHSDRAWLGCVFRLNAHSSFSPVSDEESSSLSDSVTTSSSSTSSFPSLVSSSESPPPLLF